MAFPSQFYIVADLDELWAGTVCLTRDDVIEELRKREGIRKLLCFRATYRVFRTGDGELGRDVTDEFELANEPDEYAASSNFISHGRSTGPLNYHARRGSL